MFVLVAVSCLARFSSAAAQQSQDNSPHIEPRGGTSAQHSKAKQSEATQTQSQPSRQSQQAEQQNPAPSPEPQGESSSKDSQTDFEGESRSNLPMPVEDTDDKVFRPWDPHRAAKDVEVGEYYLKQKNYRAALDRFNDALVYKQDDAEATFDLALTQEKLDLFARARQSYSRYLEILPAGPKAKECQEALKRLESRAASAPATDDVAKRAAEDIDAGEIFLSRNSYDAARERFEDALRLAPDNPKACFRLAQSLQGMQRPEPARLYYQKYLELDPHGPYAAQAKKAIVEITYIVGK